MAHRRHLNSARGGFSLIEVLISITILAILLTSVTQVGSQTSAAYDTSAARLERELEAQRALENIVAALTAASSSTFVPDPVGELGTDDLTYRTIESMAGAVTTWSDDNRIVLQLEPGELDNGVDDDLDGLTDERQVVLILEEGQANQRARVLIKGVAEVGVGAGMNLADDDGDGVVDESGFCIRRENGVLFVELAVQGRVGDAPVFTVEAETRTALRN